MVQIVKAIPFAFLTFLLTQPFSNPAGAAALAEEVSPWSREGLAALEEIAFDAGATALIVRTGGETVLAAGDVVTPSPVHSVRKAILSALIGQHVGPGPRQIELNATLADLGIDDDPPLPPAARTARVIDLLRSQSGIPRDAAAETSGMRSLKRRLLGGGKPPGRVWAYNNWDYNALTTILAQQTGEPVADLFTEGLADPLGMQDAGPENTFLYTEPEVSVHPKAGFVLSARDMARFGQLYLQGGQWQGRQILPSAWVDRITSDYVWSADGAWREGHAYLWWLPLGLGARQAGIPEGSYYASGFAGQKIMVIPAWDTVFVLKTDTNAYESKIGAFAAAQGLDPDAVTTLDRFIGEIAGAPCGPLKARTDPCAATPFVGGSDVRAIFAALAAAWTGPSAPPSHPDSSLDGIVWQPGRVSDIDALRTVLAYDGRSLSEAEAYGALGYAFAIVVQDDLQPRAATVWNFAPVRALAANLGLAVESRQARLGTDGFEAVQAQVWDTVRARLDAGRPAIAFNLAEPENYVISGYDASGYYVHGPGLDGQVGLAPWQILGRDPIGILSVSLTERIAPSAPEAALRAALRFALRHAESPQDWIFPGYTAGPAAFDAWIAALGRAPAWRSAVAARHWGAMRQLAATYLRAAAPDAASLQKAANAYDEVSQRLFEVAQGPTNVADLLLAAQAAERRALESLSDYFAQTGDPGTEEE